MPRPARALAVPLVLWAVLTGAPATAADPNDGTPGTAPHTTVPRAPDRQRTPELGGVGAGCIRPGDPILITGRGFGSRPRGTIRIKVTGRDWPLEIRDWSDRRIRLAPPRGLDLLPGRAYRLTWADGREAITDFGRVQVCASAAAPGPQADLTDVRLSPDGTPEYIASVPQAAAGQAIAVLQQLSATILRTRVLQALGETIIVVTLPEDLTLDTARAAISAAVPGGEIDLHHIYGFVAGPRVYAREMVTGGDRACALAKPVAVGMIDGPVDPAHPAIRATDPRTKSFLPDGARRASADHGTAIAALIAGAPEAGLLAGYASGARLFAAEAFWSGGTGPVSAVEWVGAALDWELGSGVRLINLSFAGRENRALARLVTAASRRGAVLIAATGNGGADEVAFPAAAPEVIAVTAVDAARRLYREANRGRAVEFAAPGVEVWAAKAGDGGQYATGTSFAAPFVTAAAAHYLAQRPNLSTDVIRQVMREKAVDLGDDGRDASFGWGIVQMPAC